MSFLGNIRRLRPQRLILDPLDAALVRRGMLAAPRPLGDLEIRVIERLGDGESPGDGTPIEPAITLETRRTPSGYLVFFDHVRDPSLGRIASGLEAGRHSIEITGRFYQPLRLVVEFSDVPPPFEALADTALTRTSVRASLEPSFLHPTLVASTATRVGGTLSANSAPDFDDVAVTIRSDGADIATYRVDPRGQWLLALDDTALSFIAGPEPRLAPVSVRVTRGTDIIATDDIDLTENALTTAPTLELPSP